MEELDLLKKAWQKDTHEYEQVSETDIYKMLHTKSSSIVKWILIISIVEVLFWTLISVIWNTDDFLKKLHAENTIIYFKVWNFINYVVILGFIYSFYKNYIKITTTASTKQLMQDILKTRRTVQYYVWYNLGMAVVSLIIGFILQFVFNPQMKLIADKIAREESYHTIWITVGIILLATVIVIGLFWIFYRLLYGILLRKLNHNYKELKKIDL
ncbi:hypothetical protein [Flavobacterium sp.]|uniref:hypothetical protein n=1 Tax=Flavobacterium sp. TaxID=239 RepID=UPI0024879218|nr:hypothetical protein [Flavobacterium sp.]MDI1317263.1 hypothetical protein [Flavobacterium sp.]